MSNWLPVVLLGIGGFLMGGVVSLWRTNRAGAVLCLVFCVGCIIGGILWLL